MATDQIVGTFEVVGSELATKVHTHVMESYCKVHGLKFAIKRNNRAWFFSDKRTVMYEIVGEDGAVRRAAQFSDLIEKFN